MKSDHHIGRLLVNRYRLQELIGKGAMGKVYRGKDVRLAKLVAVKLLASNLVNPDMCDRFETEARTSAQLGDRSPHIVQVTDYGLDDEEVPFYVMEYLQGKSLARILQAQPLPLARFLRLAWQIGRGLQCAHEGISIDDTGKRYPVIHQDIKPANILVCPHPQLGELSKLLDFGISRVAEGEQSALYMGTPPYSAPEQMVRGKTVDARSDIYSLGILFFEMLTGELPLQADTPESWRKAHLYQPPRSLPQVAPDRPFPATLQSLVMACLAKAPAERPQSLAEILTGLTQIAHTQGIDLRVNLPAPDSGIDPLPSPLPSTPDSLNEQERGPVWTNEVGIHCYSQPIVVDGETLPALWVMLPHRDIQNLQIHRFYNQIYRNFICVLSPHPMLLWVTQVINHHQKKRRGFPCYLNLKQKTGWEMVHLLAAKGRYRVLFFDWEAPHCCSHSLDITLEPQQRTQLQHWLILSQSQVAVGSPAQTKKLLETEYEKIKRKIEAEF